MVLYIFVNARTFSYELFVVKNNNKPTASSSTFLKRCSSCFDDSRTFSKLSTFLAVVSIRADKTAFSLLLDLISFSCDAILVSRHIISFSYFSTACAFRLQKSATSIDVQYLRIDENTYRNSSLVASKSVLSFEFCLFRFRSCCLRLSVNCCFWSMIARRRSSSDFQSSRH